MRLGQRVRGPERMVTLILVETEHLRSRQLGSLHLGRLHEPEQLALAPDQHYRKLRE